MSRKQRRAPKGASGSALGPDGRARPVRPPDEAPTPRPEAGASKRSLATTDSEGAGRAARGQVRAGHRGLRNDRASARSASGSSTWTASIVSAAGVGMGAGLYFWMLGGPVPLGVSDLMPKDLDPIAGIGKSLLMGFAVSALLIGILSGWGPASVWRDRLAIASLGLYLSGAFSALGSAALVLAPSAVLLALAALAFRQTRPNADGLILALHTGAFGTAVCFFHQWPRCQAGWTPFVKNLAALRALWF